MGCIRKKDSRIVQEFFAVYVKGLQGFTGKLDADGIIELSDAELYSWILNRALIIEDLQNRMQKE